MHRLVLCTLALAGAVGCTDYSFNESPDPDDGYICPDVAPDVVDPVPTPDCVREPEVGDFDPVEEWAWRTNPIDPEWERVETPPLIVDITSDGVPDMVFTAFKGSSYNSVGAFVAVDGSDGSTIFSELTLLEKFPHGISSPAAVKVDGELALFVGVSGGLVRTDVTGTPVWFAEIPSKTGGFATPSIGDVNGDGRPDIAMGAHVVDADGNLLWGASNDNGGNYPGSFLVDVDADGRSELVTGPSLFDDDGSELYTVSDLSGGWPAIGDLDGNGSAEIVVVIRSEVRVLDLLGNEVWKATFPDNGGGPPTIADFDGDGKAEVGIACKGQYRVYDGDGSLLWEMPILEQSSGITGSSVFDFEGDGAAEVVYADEASLWVFDGATGTVELKWDTHNSGTRFEYPIIADVDADGGAEIVIPHGRNMHGTTTTGFTVIGSASDSWAPARPIWSQHAYYDGVVNDDYTLPTNPIAPWRATNTFRAASSQMPSGLDLPDLRVGTPDACIAQCWQDSLEVWVPVENGGTADAPLVDLIFEAIDGTTRSEVYRETVSSVPALQTVWAGPFTLSAADFGADGLDIRVEGTVSFGTDDTYECDEENIPWHYPAWPCT